MKRPTKPRPMRWTQADEGAQGEEAADEEVAEEEAAFAVESELAGFDGVVAEAISSEPIDAAVRVGLTVEPSAVMGTRLPGNAP